MNLTSPKYTNEKGFAPILIIAVISLTALAIVYFVVSNKSSNNQNSKISFFKKNSSNDKVAFQPTQKDSSEDSNVIELKEYTVISADDEVIILTDNSGVTTSIPNDKDKVSIYSDNGSNKVSTENIVKGKSVKLFKDGDYISIYVEG